MKRSFTPAELRLAALLAGGPLDLNEREAVALAHLAVSHRVGGGVLRQLIARGHVPQGARAVLEPARDEAAGRNLLILHDVQALSEGLRRLGIEHRLVKGVALLPLLAHPGERWMVDGDVLFARKDRARVAAHLASLGLRYRPHMRHDGQWSRADRDEDCVEVLGANGAPIELHFTARPLPGTSVAVHRTSGVEGDTRDLIGVVAVGLSRHVLEHSIATPHLRLRHVSDLRALLDAGGLEALRAASVRSNALARSLAWMSALGAPELVGHIAPRPLPERGRAWQRVALLAGRVRVLAANGLLLRALLPATAYLHAQDAVPVGRSSATRSPDLQAKAAGHLARWRRIASV